MEFGTSEEVEALHIRSPYGNRTCRYYDPSVPGNIRAYSGFWVIAALVIL